MIQDADAKIKEILSIHLPYEEQLVRDAHALLNQGFSSAQQREFNIVFESFFIHARTIVEMLQNKNTNALRASDVTDNYRRPSFLPNMMERINEQIQHLSLKRTMGPERRLKLEDVNAVMAWLDHELPRFRTALKPKWRGYLASLEQSVTITVCDTTPTATNAISSSSTEVR